MIGSPKRTGIGGIGWHVSRLHASANPATRLRAAAHFLQSVAVETVEGYYRTGESSSEP